MRMLRAFWLEALCVVLVVALVLAAPRALSNDALKNRVDHLEATDGAQTSTILCLEAVVQRLAILADDVQLEVDGKPDEDACDEPPPAFCEDDPGASEACKP